MPGCCFFFPKQSFRGTINPLSVAEPTAGTLTQHRAIQLSTRSQALPGEGGPEKAAPGLPVQAGAARLGQSSAEGHDGQAEQGAEVRRGLPLCRRVGRPLGLGAEAALLGLVAG